MSEVTSSLGRGPRAVASCSTFSRHASTRFRLPMCSGKDAIDYGGERGTRTLDLGIMRPASKR
jgi:hypothetical protein